jgi:hypothetical protein
LRARVREQRFAGRCMEEEVGRRATYNRLFDADRKMTGGKCSRQVL